jgi:dCMP deaminase
MPTRIDKDSYYLGIAKAVSVKSNCLSAVFGAVIVRDDQIISTGYVGAPRKVQDCMDLGYCIRRKRGVKSGTGYEMCRSVHAEMNAIINAARAGVSLLNGDMYMFGFKRGEGDELIPIKSYPCLMCKKMIINAGLNRYVCNDKDEGILEYYIKDWVNDWQNIEDLSQDKEKYETDYSHKKDYNLKT